MHSVDITSTAPFLWKCSSSARCRTTWSSCSGRRSTGTSTIQVSCAFQTTTLTKPILMTPEKFRRRLRCRSQKKGRRRTPSRPSRRQSLHHNCPPLRCNLDRRWCQNTHSAQRRQCREHSAATREQRPERDGTGSGARARLLLQQAPRH